MEERKPSVRLKSIDALRGFDMFWISSGEAFFIALFTWFGTPFFHSLSEQLDHPKWTGFTFYDIIFPLFLFIMGTVMPLSLKKRLERGGAKSEIYKHVFYRTFLLFLLGLVYNGLFNLDFEHQRYAGVLQRFAFCYFFASVIILNFSSRARLYWIAGITLLYWLILLLVPAPGFYAYDLTPEGNLAGYIDRMLLPGSFCCYNYGDNEGLLTMFPAVVNVLFGALAGEWLLGAFSNSEKMKRLGLTGGGLILAALLWSLVLPVNKYLWTGSYTLLTSGISFLLLLLFFYLIDIRGWQRWAFPFIVIGLNPITIYVAQGIFDFGIIADIFIHGFKHRLGSLEPAFTLLCVIMVKWLFLYFLYRQKIFLKV